MRFCYIDEKYINFLRTLDSRIQENKQGKRPYVGIVLSIGDTKYYAPLTSPKAKHKEMKNSKIFRKIAEGKLGAIKLSAMIPVVDNAIIDFDINDIEDIRYRRLLQNQFRYIRKDWEGITKAASDTHNLFFSPEEKLTPYEKKEKSFCCNLKLLEQKYKEYR